MPPAEEFPNWGWSAYPTVYACVYRRLRRRCVWLSHARTVDLADDGTLSALQRAANASLSDDPTHRLRWVVLVAYRRAIDLLRRERLLHPSGSWAERVSDQPRDLSSAVWACVQQLEPNERRVLIAHHFD